MFLLSSAAQRDSVNLSSVPVRQDTGFLSADVGGNVTLRCFYGDGRTTILSWYKQAMGKKFELMSNFYLYSQEAFFFGKFRNSTRFQLVSENLHHRLTISDLQVSDSATYYCLRNNFVEYEFHDGTTVSVKGLGLSAGFVAASIRRSASGTIDSEDSRMLTCTVNAGICDEKHGIYSFRTSGESGPGLIYATGGRNTQNNHNKTCFYDLSVQNLNASRTGTDYCAVATCGHVLFGDGTKLEVEG